MKNILVLVTLLTSSAANLAGAEAALSCEF